MNCYHYGKLGHLAYRCPEKASSSQSERKVNYVQEDQRKSINQEVSLDLEKGENFLFRRVFLKEPRKEEPKQRRTLFRVNERCRVKFVKS